MDREEKKRETEGHTDATGSHEGQLTTWDKHTGPALSCGQLGAEKNRTGKLEVSKEKKEGGKKKTAVGSLR